ncbi:LysR family transcriptional regulator [Streptomyces sp. NPDC006617]|uniref:helix-turn-helix domain-containing protein n=1 Tax=Streptomyces sp. NPDC006617 TaxID=3155354 RepID=UPI0033A79E16
MDIGWLESFLALVEHGSSARAAEAQHVSQPAFSRRIRALEIWFGEPVRPGAARGRGPDVPVVRDAQFRGGPGPADRAPRQVRRGPEDVRSPHSSPPA